MKRTPLFILLALLGGLLVLLVVAGTFLFGTRLLKRTSVPGGTVLEVDLTTVPMEEMPDDAIAKVLLEGTPTVLSQVTAIRHAANDDKVTGLFARIGATGMGFARYQEYRDAILHFRESGKPAVAWSESFGEFGPGNGSYYLACAFDEIYLQPSGDLGLNGIAVDAQFLRGIFDKLDMTPQMGQRHEYKNAMNVYTETSFTAAHRQAVAEIVDSLYGQLIDGIADGRGKPAAEVRSLIDRGPFLGSEALDAGFVDALLYQDEATSRVRENMGGDVTFLPLSLYEETRGRAKGPHIALVSGIGAVERGDGGYNPFTGARTMGSARVASAFRAAVDDDDVEAIVFRVDSPGGSYVASDAIWRETVRARDAGKPVIVTMGNVAASGGYFVSMSANKIVAHPGTLTGSIGVLGGKLVTTGGYEKLGFTFDHLKFGENSTMFSDKHPYTDSEWSRLNAWLDRVYEDFTRKVADGREKRVEDVHEIAKGRVWTGKDALEIGLVDALGGYATAFRLAREALGLEPDAEIRVRRFPRDPSLMERFRNRGKPHESEWNAAIRDIVGEIRPLAKAVETLGVRQNEIHPLTAPIPAVDLE